MRTFLLIIALANSSYFVEWIPNNAATPEPAPTSTSTTTDTSPGEWPWQGGWGG